MDRVHPDVGRCQRGARCVRHSAPGPLSVVREANRLRLSWPGVGRLQSTPVLVPATWQDVAGAASPHEVAAQAPSPFYRLIR